MLSSDAGRAASRELRRVGWLLHAHVVETKLQALRDAVKTNFDPNQPRVPAGNPDGGQWTDRGGGSSSGQSERIRLAQNDSPDHLSDVPRPRKLPRDIQSLSDIPKEKPTSIQVVNAIGKFVAYELADYIMRQGERPLAAGAVRGKLLRRLLAGFEIALWVRDDLLPAIESYSDPPRTLKELQDAARSGRRPGYEIHHIVELNSATPGDADRINAPENLVRIPVFKHHLITRWFSRKNRKFGGLSPRTYLRGKSWEERTRMGLRALVRQGVLKP